MHQVLEYRIRFVRVNRLIVIRPTRAFSVSVSLDSILAIWDLFGFYNCQLEESGMKLYVRIHNQPLILSFFFLCPFSVRFTCPKMLYFYSFSSQFRWKSFTFSRTTIVFFSFLFNFHFMFFFHLCISALLFP